MVMHYFDEIRPSHSPLRYRVSPMPRVTAPVTMRREEQLIESISTRFAGTGWRCVIMFGYLCAPGFRSVQGTFLRSIQCMNECASLYIIIVLLLIK